MRTRANGMKSFLPENFLANVRPEFLGNIVEAGGFDLGCPISRGLSRTTLLRWVISIGQSCFQSITQHLGEVEARASRIGFGEDYTGKGVDDALEKTAMTEGVVAGVLVCYSGNDRFSEKGSA